jgi:hypothetical protein
MRVKEKEFIENQKTNKDNILLEPGIHIELFAYFNKQYVIIL